MDKAICVYLRRLMKVPSLIVVALHSRSKINGTRKQGKRLLYAVTRG